MVSLYIVRLSKCTERNCDFVPDVSISTPIIIKMAAAATIDTSYISNFTSISEPAIQSLINEPTAELVSAFLRAVTIKALEYDKLKSERLRLDVELENAVRGAELRSRILKANADKALQEVEVLRNKLNEEGRLHAGSRR